MHPEPVGDRESSDENAVRAPDSTGREPEHQLDARVDFEGDAAVVVVSGEIDPATAPTLDEAIRRAEDYRPHVVVDLSGVTFMDSSGLEVLVSAHTRTDAADDKRFIVRSPHAFVARVLHISGVDEILVVEPGPSEP